MGTDIRGQRIVSHMRHQRNVVSALGHLLTFAFTLSQQFMFTIGIFLIPDDPLFEKLQCLIFFLTPCTYFVLFPLIETLSSDGLRGSLFSLPREVLEKISKAWKWFRSRPDFSKKNWVELEHKLEETRF